MYVLYASVRPLSAQLGDFGFIERDGEVGLVGDVLRPVLCPEMPT